MDAKPLTLQRAKELLGATRQLSQLVFVNSKKLQGELDAVKEEVDSLTQSLSDASRKASSLPDGADKEAILQTLDQCWQAMTSGAGGDLRKYRSSSRKPLILTLLLGRHSTVVTVRKDEAYRIKEEYHSFRFNVSLFMLISAGLLVYSLWRAQHFQASHDGSPPPSASLFGVLSNLSSYSYTPIIMVGVQLFLVIMTYSYVAMAARESVLLMNGSNIRPWWIWHHYFSAITCLVTLALPVDSPSVTAYVSWWLLWTMFQALLMLAQNRYQRKRMYTRIALGKQSAMDVVGSESCGSQHQGEFFMLIPGLFVLQLWQIWLGASMVHVAFSSLLNPEGWLETERHESDLRGMRGSCVVGVLLAIMGVLNFSNTVSTIITKRRVHSAVRARTSQPSTATKSIEAHPVSGPKSKKTK